jgi:hypothetical protein
VYLDVFREKIGDLDTGLTCHVMDTSHPSSSALELAELVIRSGSELLNNTYRITTSRGKGATPSWRQMLKNRVQRAQEGSSQK